MFELSVDWKFKDIQDNIETIKTRYEDILSSFSYVQLKERGKVLHQIKTMVFGYENIQYWQRERLWEAMNGDFDLEEFRRLCK